MRCLALVSLLVAGAALVGCTSSSGIEALNIAPSKETTSSVSRPSVALAEVGATPVSAGAADTALAVNALAETEADEDANDAFDAVTKPAAPVPELRPKRAAASPAVLVKRQRFRDAKPINFGKTTPSDYPVHGVDVSRWQGEIDWPRLRAQGANFAYIKATDGGDHLDPMFRRNWKAAADAGLKRGAYHFFYWCRPASEQAAWFIRNVPRVEGALPPVLDVEWNGESRCKKRPTPTQVREKMRVFLERLEQHYGQRPVIYTAPDFYADNLRGAFQDYPFWLRAVAQHPSKVYPGREWVFWQYSGSGLSHGVKGKIDLNVFHGSERQWRQWIRGQSMVARAD